MNLTTFDIKSNTSLEAFNVLKLQLDTQLDITLSSRPNPNPHDSSSSSCVVVATATVAARSFHCNPPRAKQCFLYVFKLYNVY